MQRLQETADSVHAEADALTPGSGVHWQRFSRRTLGRVDVRVALLGKLQPTVKWGRGLILMLLKRLGTRDGGGRVMRLVLLRLLNRRHGTGGEWRCGCRGDCQWQATLMNEQASRCRHVVARIEAAVRLQPLPQPMHDKSFGFCDF
jgi:hypothetical protein